MSATLAQMPAELLYYICAYLSFTDVVALEGALHGHHHEVVHKYMMERGLKSTRHPLHKLPRKRSTSTGQIINTEIREHRNLWTAFMHAAARGQTSIMLQLLAHGAVNVHASDRDGRTALFLAAKGGYLTSVALILSQGADPQRIDRFGRTSMHYAVQEGHERVVSLLMQNGCDPQLPDSNDMTPIRLAVKARNDAVVEMMLCAIANIDSPALLVAAVEYNNEWAVRRALRHVSPNIRHKGTIPLLLSTKPKIIKVLLCDPRIDPNGRTVLIHAARNGLWSVVNLLVAKDGLDIHKIDNNGQSASDYAANMNLNRIENALSNYPLRRSQLRYTWGQQTGRRGHLHLLRRPSSAMYLT
ncbi:Ankyrin repeat-containing domain protein, partial [Metarhizium hybridum]